MQTQDLSHEILAKARAIRLLILDVDGVLTDGRLVFDEQGREYKAFHARDGHGLKMLQSRGVSVAVISGRNSPSVALRMKQLGVELVYQGYENKLLALESVLNELSLSANQVAMVGDDWLDLPVLKRAGLSIAVKDAHPEVLARVDWVTANSGGQGGVRDVCDLLFTAQGHWQPLLESYLCG